MQSKSPRLTIIGACLAAALLLGFTAPAQAQQVVDLVSNTGVTSDGSYELRHVDSAAQAFTTGSNRAGYDLESIVVVIDRVPAGPSTDWAVTLTLWSVANNGEPDSVLCTLTNPATLGTGEQAFTDDSSCATLEQETQYFVVMRFEVTTPGVIIMDPPEWASTQSDNEDSGAAANWTISDTYYYRATDTAAWVNSSSSLKIKVTGAYADDPKDREALVALYDATEGASWRFETNWKSTDPLDDWYGVTTVDGRVTELALAENILRGSIPAALGNLTNLQILRLTQNDLSGEIPADLGDLTNLDELNLDYNDLSGSIPTALGNLTNLQHLTFRTNRLSGPIPVALGDLTNLKKLNLQSNRLSGEIPAALSDLTNLEELILTDNKLTGSIPTALSDLTNLESLYLNYNDLSGSIPTALSDLTNLEVLYLHFNDLSGSIPAALGDLTNLIELDLTNNQLTGSIPTALDDLANLTGLNLSNNQLTGSIPGALGDLGNLTGLYLNNNRLTGSIPAALGDLANLTELNLIDNSLTGSIPTAFLNLDNLLDLYVDNELCVPDTAVQNWVRNLNYFEGDSTNICTVMGLSATPGDTQVVLTWRDLGDSGISKYQYRQKAGTGAYGGWIDIPNSASGGTNATGFTVTGLSNGTEYTFEVRTVNADGDGLAITVTATPAMDDQKPDDQKPGDQTRPTVEITSEATSPVTGPFDVTITFSEWVQGFTSEDIQVSNGRVADFTAVSSSEYRATITPAKAGQPVVVTVPEAGAQDGGGNGNEAAAPFKVEAKLVVRYEQERYTATEGEEPVTVTVTLNQAGDEALAIPIRVTRPETTEVGDYTVEGLDEWDAQAGTGTLTFAAEATEQTLRIAANHDGDGEDETVALGFGALPEIVLAGAPAVATVTLEDKGLVELQVRFGQAAYEVKEGQAADITVLVSPAADRRVDVPLVVALEGGTTPEDYSGVPAKVVFEEGESQGTIAIEVWADEVSDSGEWIVLSVGELPAAVSAGEPASTQVRFEQQRTAQQFTPSLEGMLAVMGRSMGESARTAIEGRFARHRQWSRLGPSGGALPPPPGSDTIGRAGAGSRGAADSGVPRTWSVATASAAMGSGWTAEHRETGTPGSWLQSVLLGSFGRAGAGSRGAADSGVPRAWSVATASAAMGSGWTAEHRETGTPGSWLQSVLLGSFGRAGAGSRGAADSGVPRAWSVATASAAMGSGWTAEHRETGTPGSWLQSVLLGSLGNLVGSGPRDSDIAAGFGMAPGGSGAGQDRRYGAGVEDAAPRPRSGDFSERMGQVFDLSGVSFEMSLKAQEQATSWVPVVWGQGDLQSVNGDVTRIGMNYRGGLEAAHVGLDLYANDQMLTGLSFMRSWGDLEYTDDGVEGVLKSRMNTVHPYLYWQPHDRVSVWGIGGVGQGHVEVTEPGRMHDVGADLRMFAGGVRSVLTRRGNHEWGLRADAFTTQLETAAVADITPVRGDTHRGRVLLEWVHDTAFSPGRSLSLQVEAGGRVDEGAADRGSGAETGFRLGFLDANSGLDVALQGRTLVAYGRDARDWTWDVRDWGVGLQASWDPGEKQRGFRVSVNSSRGQDGGGRTTLWDNAEAVTRPAGMGAMGRGSQPRMESEVAYAGLTAPGVPGLLTPYSRLRWTGQGRELAWGTAWSLRQAQAWTLEVEAIKRGPADRAVLMHMSTPF